jgi:hypothetical protein
VVVVGLAVVVARLVVVASSVVVGALSVVLGALVVGGASARLPEQAAATSRPDARIHSVDRRRRVMAIRVRLIVLSAD